jgi:hypothetical protein
MTAVAHMDHDQDYPADYLATILKEVKTIAMVGASPDPTKFSYGVLRVLHETGYDMIPVNPNEAGARSAGCGSTSRCRRSTGRWTWCRCSAAPMRCSDRARGDRDRRQGAVDAARRARRRGGPAGRGAGLKVVMNRCPKIELFRPFWKPRLNQAI